MMMCNGCQSLHPGGMDITQHFFKNIKIQEQFILDIGCGDGKSVKWLNAKGAHAVGIDIQNHSAEHSFIQYGDAHHLLFADNSMDIILMECSFSVLKNPLLALQECTRVLKKNGLFIIGDMYAKKKPTKANNTLKNIYSFNYIQKLCEEAGLYMQCSQDYIQAVHSYYASLLFHQTGEQVQTYLGASIQELNQAKCSYFMAIFTTK